MLLLSKEQIDIYLNDGVLVVDNVLTKSEISDALKGLHEKTLIKYGINQSVAKYYYSKLMSSLSSSSSNNDNESDENNNDEVIDIDIWDDKSIESFIKLSSTNGSGGVLDIFYEDWKLKIATNPKIWNITKQLWIAAYNNNNNQENFKHQYGNNDEDKDIDYNKGYMYIDRIGYRLPTNISQQLGDRYYSNTNSQNNNNDNDNKSKKKKKNKKSKNSIQRSLTPHLDCCPDTFYSTQNKTKWRPIQCFVSLTDNLEKNTGGFEAVKGFHKQFDNWIKTRLPTTTKVNNGGDSEESISIPPPCIGEYTHMRPKEDYYIYGMIEHIPIKAGSIVLWDNRIPHSNSYKHNGLLPRIVVYCSFLPADIQINRQYMKKQLIDYQSNIVPKDQWNHIIDNENDNNEQKQENEEEKEESTTTTTDDEKKKKKNEEMPSLHSDYKFTDLGRKLIGLDPW